MDFKDAIEFVLEEEGLCNDKDAKADLGGLTCYGISSRKYPEFYVGGRRPARDEAIQVYFVDYWQKFGCDKMTWPMNVIVLDTGINMHTSIVEVLQKNSLDWQYFLFRRILQYLLIVKLNPQMLQFLRTWIGRVYRLYRFIRSKKE